MLTDEYRYKVLKILGDNPNVSQRDISRRLGISLGKVNYCLKALAEKGMIKASNFKNSSNKQAYIYLLTPQGLEHKTRSASRFLKSKLQEYQSLQQEIEQLRQEILTEQKQLGEDV